MRLHVKLRRRQQFKETKIYGFKDLSVSFPCNRGHAFKETRFCVFMKIQFNDYTENRKCDFEEICSSGPKAQVLKEETQEPGF